MSSTARALADAIDRATRPVVQAVADLRAVREQWGDLLAAIARRPAAGWPPRECAGFLDQLAADDRADDDALEPAAARVGRLPLTLREHPAPLNLDALDAALAVERDLFDLADLLAAAIQRPVRTGRDRHGRFVRDEDDASNPARWHPVQHRDAGPAAAVTAGSRAYGLHWAAVWLEGRMCGEDTDGDLFDLLPPYLLEQAVEVAARARRTVERALERDGRTTHLDDPCPWCGGQLVGRTRSGGEPVVTCSTGGGCGAPATLDRGRRTWRGAELVGLWAAMDAARNRAEDSAP
ncbi:hypothetical protein [Streptomyces griseoflavus]|uniref:hypothetical protein n=1 Tax=Streptomyces griseoflavus TaxID=35619 RepID=UPI0033DB0436